jgi:hypothetical protein
MIDGRWANGSEDRRTRLGMNHQNYPFFLFDHCPSIINPLLGQARARRTIKQDGAGSPDAGLSPLISPSSHAKWRDLGRHGCQRRRSANDRPRPIGSPYPHFPPPDRLRPLEFCRRDNREAPGRIMENTSSSNCWREIRRPGSPAGTGKPGLRIEGEPPFDAAPGADRIPHARPDVAANHHRSGRDFGSLTARATDFRLETLGRQTLSLPARVSNF